MLFVIHQRVQFTRTKQILRSRCNHYLREENEEDSKKKRRRKSSPVTLLIPHYTASVASPSNPSSSSLSSSLTSRSSRYSSTAAKLNHYRNNKECNSDSKEQLITPVILSYKTCNYLPSSYSSSSSSSLLLLFQALIIILISALLSIHIYSTPIRLASCFQLKPQQQYQSITSIPSPIVSTTFTTTSSVSTKDRNQQAKISNTNNINSNNNNHNIINDNINNNNNRNINYEQIGNLGSQLPAAESNRNEFQVSSTSIPTTGILSTRGRSFGSANISGDEDITLNRHPSGPTIDIAHHDGGPSSSKSRPGMVADVPLENSSSIRQRVGPTMKVAGSMAVSTQRHHLDGTSLTTTTTTTTTTQAPSRNSATTMVTSNMSQMNSKHSPMVSALTSHSQKLTPRNQQPIKLSTLNQESQPRLSSSFRVSSDDNLLSRGQSHQNSYNQSMEGDQLDSSSSISTVSQTLRLTGNVNRQQLSNQHPPHQQHNLNKQPSNNRLPTNNFKLSPTTTSSIDGIFPGSVEFESGASESSNISERTAPTQSYAGSEIEGSSTGTTTMGELDSQIVTNRTTAQLTCDTGEMILKLNFSEPYRGIAYPDYNRLSPCKFYGDGQRYYEIHLPLKGCGTRQASPRVFMNNVVVRFHRSLELEEDEIKTIICRYPPPLAPLPPSHSMPPIRILEGPPDDATILNGNNNNQLQPFDIIEPGIQDAGVNRLMANSGSNSRSSGKLLDQSGNFNSNPRLTSINNNLLDDLGSPAPGLTRDLAINNSAGHRSFLDNLGSYELLLIIGSILFLSLLILALASGWYCIKQRQHNNNLVILKRKRRYVSAASITPSSPDGSDLSGTMANGQANLLGRNTSPRVRSHGPIVIPRAVNGANQQSFVDNSSAAAGQHLTDNHHHQIHHQVIQYDNGVNNKTLDWAPSAGYLDPIHKRVAVGQQTRPVVVGRRGHDVNLPGQYGHVTSRSTGPYGPGGYTNLGYQYHRGDERPQAQPHYDLSANNNNRFGGPLRSAMSYNDLHNGSSEINKHIDPNSGHLIHYRQQHLGLHKKDLDNLLAIPYASSTLVHQGKGSMTGGGGGKSHKRVDGMKYPSYKESASVGLRSAKRRSYHHNQSFIDSNNGFDGSEHQHGLSRAKSLSALNPLPPPPLMMMTDNGQVYYDGNGYGSKGHSRYPYDSRYLKQTPIHQVKHYLFDEEDELHDQNEQQQQQQQQQQHYLYYQQRQQQQNPSANIGATRINKLKKVTPPQHNTGTKKQPTGSGASQATKHQPKSKITIKNIEDSYITINHEIETSEYMMREDDGQSVLMRSSTTSTTKQAPPPPPVRSSSNDHANKGSSTSSSSSTFGSSDPLANQLGLDTSEVPLIRSTNNNNISNNAGSNDSVNGVGQDKKLVDGSESSLKKKTASILAQGGAITEEDSSDGQTGSSTLVSSSSLLGTTPGGRLVRKSTTQKAYMDDMRSLTELDVDFARSIMTNRMPSISSGNSSSEFQPSVTKFSARPPPKDQSMKQGASGGLIQVDYMGDKVPSLIGVLDDSVESQMDIIRASTSGQTSDKTTVPMTTEDKANKQQQQSLDKPKPLERQQSPDFILSPDYDYDRLEFEPSSRNSVSYV